MPEALAFPTPFGAGQHQKSAYTPDQANGDCQKLKKAMKGLGTDEKTIIQVLGRRTPEEVVTICKTYRHNLGCDLQKELKKETSGNFSKLLVAITTPPADFDAELTHKAIEGLGTDESLLIEVLVGRSNSEIRDIKEAYKVLYGKDISDEVKGDTSGHVKTLFAALLEGCRNETGHGNVESDVDALYRAGEGKFGTDEKAIINLLTRCPEEHLRAVFEMYQRRYRADANEVIQKEFSGDLRKALLSVVDCIQNRPRWIARHFEKAMAGLGTDDSKLIRLVTRFRHPAIMNKVKEAYRLEFDKTLADRIHGETSGDFRKLLLELIGEPK